MDSLILRPQEGFGEGDYEVVHDRKHVGRSYLATATNRHCVNWYWGLMWVTDKPGGGQTLFTLRFSAET
jgi:hypothetical protein